MSLIGLKRKAQREGWAKWIRTPADEHALLSGCWFDVRRAEHVEEFFATFLRHSNGDFAGQPFTLLPWQREDLFYPLFGWVRRNERGNVVRRFTKAYVEIPKKNGKSTIASGVGLYMLVGDGEQGAEVYSAASDRDQAGIVHREAINMVDASPELTDALTVNRSTHTISFPETRSFYRALASVPKRNEGFKAHCIIADELHQWVGQQGRALYDAIRWAFAARTQPLFFQITTAGEDMQSVCKEQHDYAKMILNGKSTDDRFFPYIRAADRGDDPWDEETWHKANPSLGDTITVESFRADAEEAKKTPRSVARFKRYRLNVWTTGDDPWIHPDDWAACKAEFSEVDLRGCLCYAGLDLSRTRDTSSLQLIFPDQPEPGCVRILSYFWLPEERAKEQAGTVPYLLWAGDKLIVLIPGNVIEYSYIEDTFKELAELFDIRLLLYDKTYAEDTTFRMSEATGVERAPFAQSWTNFAGPTAEFERLVLSRKIQHNGHAVMAWQIENTIVKTDNNANKRPIKAGPNDPRKIDGVVAAIMGLSPLVDSPNTEEQSIYSATRGLLSF